MRKNERIARHRYAQALRKQYKARDNLTKAQERYNKSAEYVNRMLVALEDITDQPIDHTT